MVSIFIDTNILIKFKPITEIDWKKFVGDDVEIIITPIVISELDNKKIHSNQKIREKARKSIQLIEKIRNSIDRILERTTKITFINEPLDEIFTSNRLNDQKADDRIIASVIETKLNKEKVILISDDTSLRTRANEFYNIEVLNLPEAFEINIIEDEKNIKIKVLENAIKDLKNKEPKLSITFPNNALTKVCFIKNKDNKREEYIESNMKNVYDRYPKEVYKDTSIKSGSEFIAGLLTNSIVLNFGKPTEEDVIEYNKKLDDFYSNYKRHLSDHFDYNNDRNLIGSISFIVHNTGTQPADDIRIFLHFPDGFNVLEEHELPRKPVAPSAPILKGKYSMSDLMNIGKFPSMNYHLPTNLPSITQNVSGFNIKKTNSYDVKCRVKRIMHKTMIELDNVFIQFEDYESANSFEIDYKMIAENIADEVKGKLKVRVNKK